MKDQQPDFAGGNPAGDRHPSLRTTVYRMFTPWSPPEVVCWFRYSARDPLAVGIDLVPVEGTAATWVVGRDLLDAGTREPSGEGDFRVWPDPVRRGSGRGLYFSLDRPDGQATFEADLAEVRRWLDSTYAMVPAGCEGGLLDWAAVEAIRLGAD
ncbi:SsgA family sporulation/cell division regulator [Streptomyces sp. NPDC001380]|uniref:SsgA family sporulation/cell division regulator n=1 Tax=Streptomyces sp. NPDC001380 TaxID=3364566 RepID=UPI00369711CA